MQMESVKENEAKNLFEEVFEITLINSFIKICSLTKTNSFFYIQNELVLVIKSIFVDSS